MLSIRAVAAEKLPPIFSELQKRQILPCPWRSPVHHRLNNNEPEDGPFIAGQYVPNAPLAPCVMPAIDEASREYLKQFESFDIQMSQPLAFGVRSAD